MNLHGAIALCIVLMAGVSLASPLPASLNTAIAAHRAAEAGVRSEVIKALYAAAKYSPVPDWNQPKPKQISADASSEENVPGLQPTDGAARRANMPDLGRFAPIVDMFVPLVPLTQDLVKAVGLETNLWQVDDLMHPKFQGVLLAPTKEAYAKLPEQIVTKAALPVKALKVLMEAPLVIKLPVFAKLQSELVKQTLKNHVLVKLITDDMMNNGTQVLTKAGETLTIVVKKDGSKYYRTKDGMEARIVKPDVGFGPVQVHFVDSFIFPKFKW